MRAEMARILALPDFAGLSQPYSKISPSHLPSFHTVLKRRRSASSDSPQVHSKQVGQYSNFGVWCFLETNYLFPETSIHR